MLNHVKEMIIKKQEYLEAASILFDDATNNVDDLIFLNESPDVPEDDEDIDDKDETSDEENDMDNSDDEDESKDEVDDESNDDVPVGDKEDSEDNDNDDVFDRSIEDEEIKPTISDDDDLPDIMGKQTGEPIDGGIDDILDVTMDLKSNTVSDTLPVPPDGAGEAIATDDILNTRIDSGFGNSDPGSSELSGIEDKKEDVDIMTEAISLDGDPDENNEDAGSSEPAEDLGNTPEDTGEENEVTSAVRDKVSEADEPIDGGEDKVNGKEELLKKLGSITKSLEDAKRAVMNTIQ